MLFDDWAVPGIATQDRAWNDDYFDGPGLFGSPDSGFGAFGLSGDGLFDEFPSSFGDINGDIETGLLGPLGFLDWNQGIADGFSDLAVAEALPFMLADTPFAVPSYSMKLLAGLSDVGSSFQRLSARGAW